MFKTCRNQDQRRQRLAEIHPYLKDNAQQRPSTFVLNSRKDQHDLRMAAERLHEQYGVARSFSTRTYSADEIVRGFAGQEYRSLLITAFETGIFADTRTLSRKPEFHRCSAEVRSEVIGGKKKIVGYAAVFNQLSEPLKIGNRSVRERVMPGAFDRCLRSMPDIRALFNHDPSKILGRTPKTMNVSVDQNGLRYEVEPPDTSYARDLMISMERGDITQSSFGFTTDDDSYVPAGDDGLLIRELRAVSVFDCSPVVFPAYTGASSGVA